MRSQNSNYSLSDDDTQQSECKTTLFQWGSLIPLLLTIVGLVILRALVTIGNHRPLMSIEFNNGVDFIVYHTLFWGAIASYVFGLLLVILISVGIHFSRFRNKTNSRILVVFLISLPFLLFLSLSSFTMLVF